MPRDHRAAGFMTQEAHLLGVVLMVIMISVLVPLLVRWIESPLLLIGAFIVLFIPVFVVSHGLADLLLQLRDDLLRGDPEGGTDENPEE